MSERLASPEVVAGRRLPLRELAALACRSGELLGRLPVREPVVLERPLPATDECPLEELLPWLLTLPRGREGFQTSLRLELDLE
jgi:hypothetical protein